MGYTFALAAFAVSLSWPGAGAGVLVEDQTIWAGDQVGLASRAEEELVADGGVAVLEVTVLARAVGGSVSRLCKYLNILIICFSAKKREI